MFDATALSPAFSFDHSAQLPLACLERLLINKAKSEQSARSMSTSTNTWENRSTSSFFHRYLVNWHSLGRAERDVQPVVYIWNETGGFFEYPMDEFSPQSPFDQPSHQCKSILSTEKRATFGQLHSKMYMYGGLFHVIPP
jgi:hypothetical protein